MRQLDITRSFLTVNAGRKILGEVVSVIVLAFIPVDSNLFENFFVAKPMHVHVLIEYRIVMKNKSSE